MDKVSVINEVYEYLVGRKLVKNRTDFASRIGIHKSNLSTAMKGGGKYLTEGLFRKIMTEFPFFNAEYLLTGQGSLIKDASQVQHIKDNGTGIMNNAGSVQVGGVQAEESVTALIDELAEQRKLTEQALAQNDRLITIIEKLTEK